MPIAGEEFHVQVPGVNGEKIVQNAIKIHGISPEKIVIKIPLNNEGAKAIKKLKENRSNNKNNSYNNSYS